MLLPELTTYLQSYTPTLSLTGGTNLFYGMMPTSPDLCVALFEYGGAAPGLTLGSATIADDHPRVHVMVRGAKEDYDTPRLLINKIVAAFAAIQDATLSGVKYQAVVPVQPPFSMGRDDNFRCLFSCNFQVMKDWSN